MGNELKVLNYKIDMAVEALEEARNRKDCLLREVTDKRRLFDEKKRGKEAYENLLNFTDDDDLKVLFSREISGYDSELSYDHTVLSGLEAALKNCQDSVERAKNYLEKLYELRNAWKDSVGATHR